MYDFVIRYHAPNSLTPNLGKVQASTIEDAKRKASKYMPNNRKKWKLLNGYTWAKEGTKGTKGTLYLLIPHELMITRPLPSEREDTPNEH